MEGEDLALVMKSGRFGPDIIVSLDTYLGDFTYEKTGEGTYSIKTHNVEGANKLCQTGKVEVGLNKAEIYRKGDYAEIPKGNENMVPEDHYNFSQNTQCSSMSDFDFRSEEPCSNGQAIQTDTIIIRYISQTKLSLMEKQGFLKSLIDGIPTNTTCVRTHHGIQLTGPLDIIGNLQDKIYEWVSTISEIHIDINKKFNIVRRLSESSLMKINEFFKEFAVINCDSHEPEMNCLTLMFRNLMDKKCAYEKFSEMTNEHLFSKTITAHKSVVDHLKPSINGTLDKYNGAFNVNMDGEVIRLLCDGDLESLEAATKEIEALVRSTKCSSLVLKKRPSSEFATLVKDVQSQSGVLIKTFAAVDTQHFEEFPKERAAIVGQAMVSIIFGDICDQEVDVVVNSPKNIYRLNQGKISCSILGKSGSGLQEECSKKLLNAGEVLETGGYNFPCKKMFHIYARLMRHQNNPVKYMEDLIASCLDHAHNGNFRSIAFPPAGFEVAKAMGLRISDFVKAYFNAIENLATRAENVVKDIRMVINHKDLVEEFKNYMEGLVDNEMNPWKSTDSWELEFIGNHERVEAVKEVLLSHLS